MSWLTKVALKNRWLTFLIVIIITGVSVWATLSLKQELIPDMDLPVTSIVTVYPQATPDEVAEKVSAPIESIITGMSGLNQVYSTSSVGMSVVFAMFEYGTDMDKVNDTIRQQLETIGLPVEVRNFAETNTQLEHNPQLYEIDLNMMPVVLFGLNADMSVEELYDIAINDIAPRLEKIDGVYEVGVEGGATEKVLVSLNPEQMNQNGISVSEVAAVLSLLEFNSVESLRQAPVSGLTLEDIATVELGLTQGTPISRTNGQPSINISVMKDKEANTVQVANAVVAELEEVKKELANGINLEVTLDQSTYIEKSISELARNALIGFVLATIVVFLFLMVFRASIVTAISIPLSIVIGFMAMKCFGITINILTLSAMAVVVGRVIDNSIVVLEVIYRRMQQGEPFKEAAIEGVREVAVPITSATLATIVIFTPLFFIGGIIGELFVPFSITIIFALIASLLVALMVIPPLSNFPVSDKKQSENGKNWYQKFYEGLLHKALKYRVATVSVAMALFLGSFALLPIIGTSFIPSMSEKIMTVTIDVPPGSTLSDTENIAITCEEFLKGNPMVIDYQTTIGISNSMFGAMMAFSGSGGSNSINLMVYLDEDADMTKEAEDYRQSLLTILGKDSFIVSTQESQSSQMMGGGLEITVNGDNLEDIKATSLVLLSELQDLEGVAEVELSIPVTEPALDIVPDPKKIMASGYPMENLEQLQQEFALLMMGGTVSTLNDQGRDRDIYIEGIIQNISSLETVTGLRIGYPESVALGDIADVSFTERPGSVVRTGGKLSATITGLITAEDIGSVNHDIQQKIDALPEATGVEVTMGGMAEMMTESFTDMYVAMLFAIVLAYAVLVVSFRSFIIPIMLMMSLPLSFIGAFLGLLISGQTLGISAMMGLLMLIGIVLTNSIVLISSVEQFRKSGMSVYDAIVEGGSTRVRPILMTALTTMIAMLPLAMGLGEGTVMSAELAVVVIGGLFTSTLLTLLVVPAIYSLLNRFRRTSS